MVLRGLKEGLYVWTLANTNHKCLSQESFIESASTYRCSKVNAELIPDSLPDFRKDARGRKFAVIG